MGVDGVQGGERRCRAAGDEVAGVAETEPGQADPRREFVAHLGADPGQARRTFVVTVRRHGIPELGESTLNGPPSSRGSSG